jgi:hypothetical protein
MSDILHWQLKAGASATACGDDATDLKCVSLLVEYVTCPRCKDVFTGYMFGRADERSRGGPTGQKIEFLCHWLLRAYEAECRDTSYEDGESLREVMRQINQVLSWAGYEPEGPSRPALLEKSFVHFDGYNLWQQSGEDSGRK